MTPDLHDYEMQVLRVCCGEDVPEYSWGAWVTECFEGLQELGLVEYRIRAITPPDATAAAARVLLGDEAMIEQIAEKFARKDKFGLVEPFALEESVSDLRDCLSAIAGDTP